MTSDTVEKLDRSQDNKMRPNISEKMSTYSKYRQWLNFNLNHKMFT